MQRPETSVWESAKPWPPLESELDPASTALLLIDLQRQALAPRAGQTAEEERRRRDFLAGVETQTLPNCARLLDFFRRQGMRVVHVTSGPELPDGCDLGPIGRRRNEQLGDAWGQPPLQVRGSVGHALLDLVAPRPDELVVNKLGHSPFNSTNLDNLLRNLGVQSVVIAGLGSDAGVESTARGASDLGYQGVVVADAIAGDDPFLHRQMLRAYLSIFGRVQTTNGILAELAGDQEVATRESDALVGDLVATRQAPMDQLDRSPPEPPFELDLEWDRTALLVVDMQYFCHPGHGHATAMETVKPGYTDYRRDRFLNLAVPNCRRLLAAFRGRGRQVVFLTIAPELPDGTSVPLPMLRRNRQRERLSGRRVSFPVGTLESQVIAELQPLPGELVVNKLTASAFMSSKLDAVLRHLGVTSLVIVGVASNACVESTARDAADRGYRCWLVEDACAGYEPAAHVKAMRAFGRHFGRVTSTADVLAALQAVEADVAAYVRLPGLDHAGSPSHRGPCLAQGDHSRRGSGGGDD